ncbi:MAG: excinuclease ABC subunit UvrA, partial [bacterium]
MELKSIFIKGAREHNLKNIDVAIPRNKLVIITGLSGSGKSSLAFDTIYAEGQRRYVESLSAYARQFLGLMEKPDVDFIEGLSPAISIQQKSGHHNPRSTVGTITEIYDYLRLLYARIGTPYCYECGRKIESQTVTQIVDDILSLAPDTRIQIMSPLVRGRKGEYQDLFKQILKDGYIRVRVDGTVSEIEERLNLDRNRKHNIDVVIDRLIVSPKIEKRLSDSIQTGLRLSDGLVIVDVFGARERIYSERFACTRCGISYMEITPRMFSFNSPYGACPQCDGLGAKLDLDPNLVVPDQNLSINQGAIAVWGHPSRGKWYNIMYSTVADFIGADLNTPWKKLTTNQQKTFLYGSGNKKLLFKWNDGDHWNGQVKRPFEGVIPNILRRYRETKSEAQRAHFEKYMNLRQCTECSGARLKKEALAIKINGKNIAEVAGLTFVQAVNFFNNLELTPTQSKIAKQILKEINNRLGFLHNVGLDYLSLNRTAGTLSGGEAQRIRLATQIGSQLMGVLYILDEPSIGLHQRDNKKLLDTLIQLRDMGNTVLVVEHDRTTMEQADYIVDLGPGAGILGGRVVAAGAPASIKKNPDSITGMYLMGQKRIDIPETRRTGNGFKLILTGAGGHNLKEVDFEVPLGKFICVTGVSGSGKSSLVNETLFPALAGNIYNSRLQPLSFKSIKGLEFIDKVIRIDQSPIGRTPRSNPATYTKLFDLIRDLFSQLPESKIRGYKPGRFSFNVKGGRCESCQGDGVIKIEMHFLPDVYVRCDVCKGKRYNRETLQVHYRGKSIADILDMSVNQAFEFFNAIPQIKNKLETLLRVGLGYIKIGQQATTLSGGEAQRVKLSSELSKRSTGRTIYILDEPTTGLHFEDIKMLLKVLHGLVDLGNTVVVIEHNMDVIKTADHVIDLGPEGGDMGGEIIAQGTPELVAGVKTS